MKNFKIKYLSFAFMLVYFASCSTSESVKDIESSEQDTNAFVFDKDINNYVIDGVVNNDHEAIAAAAKDAWNIHYDYSENKVVISTTPNEFEKYRNSSVETRNEFETSTEEEQSTPPTKIRNLPKNNQSSNQVARATTTDIDILDYEYAEHTDYLKYHHHYNGSASNDFNVKSYAMISNNTNTVSDDTVWEAKDGNNNSGIPLAISYSRASLFKSAGNTGNYATLTNHSNSKKKSVTFYKYVDYVAPTSTVTLSKNTSVRIEAQARFKYSETTTGGARSYKINNNI